MLLNHPPGINSLRNRLARGITLPVDHNKIVGATRALALRASISTCSLACPLQVIGTGVHRRRR